MRPIIPVILCGGAGTRLWPLSRDSQPKQLLRLVSDHSLLQDTLLRTQALGADRVQAPIIVCNEAHRFVIAEQLRELDVTPQAVVLEPKGRNTAPAVAIAALVAQAKAGGPPGTPAAPGVPGTPGAPGVPQAPGAPGAPETPGLPLLLVLPADHVVLDAAAFAAAVDAAAEAADAGYLVTFGIVPDKPETGYGYIRKGADQGRWAVLEDFVEKPDLETAQRYVAGGDYLWNSGMFVFGVQAVLEELERHAGDIVSACRAAFDAAETDKDFTWLGSDFAECPADSIDYAVMEKTEHAAVVPLDAGWNDIGSWRALHEVLEGDASGNVVRGEVIAQRCRGSYLHSTGRLVVGIGLEDLVVVETEDAVVVMARDAAQDIKGVVEGLKGR